MTKVIVGSRRSNLAKAQAKEVIKRLQEKFPNIQFIHRLVGSDGDKDRKTQLQLMGGVGAFTKEIEFSLLSKEIDIAVHSLKDLPTVLQEDLLFAGTIEREDPRDALCGCSLSGLPVGAKVGTGSLRRQAQLLNLRNDLNIIPIRGNVPPRLARIKGEYPLNAVVLAAAGIKRLGLDENINELLDTDIFPPAAGQGALGIQIRKHDELLMELISSINNQKDFTTVNIERKILNILEGGCSVPVGIFASYINSVDIKVIAKVTSIDGLNSLTVNKVSKQEDRDALIEQVIMELEQKGAKAILDEIKLKKEIEREKAFQG